MTSLTIEMLPGCEGDCLLVTCDDGQRARHILIDAGRKATHAHLRARLAELTEKELELFVVTHVDRDHIEGAIDLLEDPACPVRIREVWFNGYHHLLSPDKADESYGPVMGERLTRALTREDWKKRWNAAFHGAAAYVPAAPPRIALAGAIEITLLSPTAEKLSGLALRWKQECEEAGIVLGHAAGGAAEPGDEAFGGLTPATVRQLADEPFVHDTTAPNGSSIAFILEFGKARVLFAADAHVDCVAAALDQLRGGKKMAFDAVKVSHHGSERNTSKELLERISCPRYLVSTNGNYFKHPSSSAIARLVVHGGAKSLHFNYCSEFTKRWDDAKVKQAFRYATDYPEAERDGHLTVTIPA